MADEAWIDTVRLARELGNVSHLLPAGVRSLRDIPYRLHQAIRGALTFIGFEELDKDDVPPRNIWTDGPALTEHFEQVRRKHEEKTAGREIEDPQRNAAIDMLVV